MPAPQEVRKSILVIKGLANSLQAVEQFLRNREWRIHSTANLKEALTYLISQKPSFVMISIDHPNRKVRSLPKILNQAFPVHVMAYAESNTAVSYKNLLDSGCDYRINPPATGPGVERTINKILKDQELEKERRNARPDDSQGPATDSSGIVVQGGDSTGGLTRIAGGAGTSDGGIGGALSMSEILRQMSDGTGDDGEGAPFSEDPAASAEAPFMAAPPLRFGGETGDPVPMGEQEEAEPAVLSAAKSGGGQWVPLDRPATAEKPMARYDEDDINALDRPGRDDEAPVLDFDSALKKKNAEATGPTERGGAFDGLPAVTVIPRSESGFTRTESIMVRGTQLALDESVEVKGRLPGAAPAKVGDSSNVACLVVESPRFSGYLVAALGKNRRIDEKFIETIKERLFKFLKDNGEDVSNEGTMSLKIKKVDFEDWAIECAEFLRKSVHNGEEIAMAFFPFAEAKTKVGDSASVEMGAVDVHEIHPDVTLEFNLYIYLPTNQKYVLYTPRGSKFYGNQKERLIEMGVSHVHVKRTEVRDVDKYRAQNYLNSKIDEFQGRKRGA